jgi:hypothetical protein
MEGGWEGPAACSPSAVVLAVVAPAQTRLVSLRLVLAQLPFEPLCSPCPVEYPSLDREDSLIEALQSRVLGGAH